MRHLQAVMGEHATPASLQISDLLLSWDKGELPVDSVQFSASVQSAWCF